MEVAEEGGCLVGCCSRALDMIELRRWLLEHGGIGRGRTVVPHFISHNSISEF